MVYCETSKSGLMCSNTWRTCAERNLLDMLIQDVRRKGIPQHKAAYYFKCKHGDLIISRMLGTGEQGDSLPCIFCRRRMEDFGIRWRAYYKGRWVDSSEDDVPESKLTHKQMVSFRK